MVVSGVHGGADFFVRGWISEVPGCLPLQDIILQWQTSSSGCALPGRSYTGVYYPMDSKALPKPRPPRAAREEPPPDEAGERNGASIQSVITAALVLEELARGGAPTGVTDLARRLGSTRAKAHRYLATLRQAGLVDQDAVTDKYRLGWKLLGLSHAAMEQMEIRKLAEPYLAALRDVCGLTVAMSVPANGVPVVVSSLPGPDVVTLNVQVGARLVPHATAHGRVTLAFSPPGLAQALLGQPLRAMTPRTPTRRAEIMARLPVIRKQLYEQSVGESLLGISTLAAPILDTADRLVAVVAMVGLDQYVTAPPSATHVRMLLGCAAALSGRLDSRHFHARGIAIPDQFKQL